MDKAERLSQLLKDQPPIINRDIVRGNHVPGDH